VAHSECFYLLTLTHFFFISEEGIFHVTVIAVLSFIQFLVFFPVAYYLPLFLSLTHSAYVCIHLKHFYCPFRFAQSLHRTSTAFPHLLCASFLPLHPGSPLMDNGSGVGGAGAGC
jgi:hypothetical protein